MCARGSVNAVPLSCSAYSPSGARCGELRPDGQRAGHGLRGVLVAEPGEIGQAASEPVTSELTKPHLPLAVEPSGPP